LLVCFSTHGASSSSKEFRQLNYSDLASGKKLQNLFYFLTNAKMVTIEPETAQGLESNNLGFGRISSEATFKTHISFVGTILNKI
jgi:hypothetical protein